MEITTLRGSVRPVIQTKCYSGDLIKRMRWAGHAAHTRKRSGAYGVLVGKTKGRSRIRWAYKIEWILKKLDVGTDWI